MIARTITYGEWRGTITASQMNYDWSASAQAAYTDGRDHFLTQGRAVRRQTLGKQWSVETKYGNNRTGAPAGPDGTGSGR